jgi:drug/metabolite transporter (DMT)-like permease
MAIISVCLASLFLAIGNLFMRKSIDSGGGTKTYLALQLSFSLIVAILLGPVKAHTYAINGQVTIFGMFTGLMLVGLLFFLGKALEKGPSGLTFSILSSAAVFPGLVMALIYGKAHGFTYTVWHAIGSVLVIAGLFWASKKVSGFDSALVGQNPRRIAQWLVFVAMMFVLHILLLLLYQWRGLILSTDQLSLVTGLFTPEKLGSEWFVPMMYLGAVSVQMAVFLKTERRWPSPKEWLYSFAGGTANSLCTFFLLYGTKTASALESLVIFPIYSIGTIVFSNLWSQRLYGEQVNWRACQICAVGIVLASVDWRVALSAFGW